VTTATLCACGLDKSGLLPLDTGTDANVAGDVDSLEASDGDDSERIVADGSDESAAFSDVPTALLEGAVDSTTMAADDAAGDRPLNGPLLPIVFDGGAIADPQFNDAQWTSFCVALAACGEMPGISACIGLLSQPSSPEGFIPSPAMVGAVVNAGADCARIGGILGDGAMCSSSSADMCSGDSLVTCRWGFRMTVDCETLGMTCSLGSADAGCGFGDCSLSQEGKTYCVGPSQLAKCTGGRYLPFLDCQTFGAKCVGPDEMAACQGTAGPVGCSSAPACNGASILECMDGRFASANCPALYGSGFTCISNDAGIPVCAMGTACDPATYADACIGNHQASFCNAGMTATYDCKANGWMSGCTAGRCAP
jgi:hypothetical protein